ncbi:site-specific integrase [Oryzomonas rubra]|uniref:Site-specific integrase n=1 Tax=Oryzomonas rubra TaxID=2509454 RepID=A0A5A9XER3_9BACT|nr:site-specific integrase [Oryzomonas rubra]KAA0891647.1 site-specific integrase [Oryzomonas rubra]
MFINKHILLRNGFFYYRVVIPNDLKQLFPLREIKQSLGTKDRKIAECHAFGIESKVQQAFSILRSGVFSQDTLSQLISSIIQKVTRHSTAQLNLSDLISKYIQHHEKEWVPKSKMEVISECRLLLDIVGNRRIIAITRPLMLELRATLEKLPPNLYKKFPQQSINEILSLSDIVPMSLTSVNKHIMRMGAVLRYAVREGLLYRNVAESLMIPVKKSSDEERCAYSDEEICKVITLLTNCNSSLKDERKWIALIGIFSGMRQDEICQLYFEDIQKINDVWCFNINDEKDKKLKNISSRRIVPIHLSLLKLGLLTYIDNIRGEECERLWPQLTFSKINGYSNLYGKWFQRFNRKYITQDKRKVFHSFRHSFANKLKQQGVSESLIAELMGHKNHSITMGRYGKKYEIKMLVKTLQKLSFN